MKSRFIAVSMMTLTLAAATYAQPPQGFRRPGAQAGQQGAQAGQQGAEERPDRGARPEKFITRMLQLDATQQNQLHTYLEESRVASQPLREQLPDLRKSLMEAIKANDTAQIDSLTTQIANLEQQLSAIRAKTAAKTYAMLTEEQKAEVGPGLGMLLNGGFGPMGRGDRGPGPGGRGPNGPPPSAPAPQQ